METEFDPAKDIANVVKHGISLARVGEMQVQSMFADVRRAYSETRYLAYGLIDGLPHCLAFTYRSGRIRAISLRRAHLREYRRHVG